VRSTAILLSFALLSQPMAMVVLFAPLVFLDPAHAPWYNWAGYGARYAPGVALAAVGYFLFQMWRHVNAVRRDVAFCFVDHGDEPRLCGLIEPLAIASGIDAPHVGVIESPAMNAFACGVTRNLSVLVFTRGLINGLDDDELSAVIAHELIHIGNGDTRLIAAANVFMRTLGLLNRANIFKPKRYRQIAILLFAPILFPVYLGVALLAQLCVRLGYASRLMISSAREFIADAEAIRLTQDPAALVSALRGIEGDWTIAGLAPEQDAMMIAGAAQGVLATHPPIAERIEAIVAMTGAIALDSRPRPRPASIRQA
jgi:Zn-dependent protease with chaperone function